CTLTLYLSCAGFPADSAKTANVTASAAQPLSATTDFRAGCIVSSFCNGTLIRLEVNHSRGGGTIRLHHGVGSARLRVRSTDTMVQFKRASVFVVIARAKPGGSTMKRNSRLTIAAAVAATMVGTAIYAQVAQDKYSLKSPSGIAFSDFKGYED